MIFILALALAIPTYGISIILLFIYMYLKTSNLSKNMEKAIVNLSTDSYPLGTCFKEIQYVQALAYADEVGNIISQSGKYIEFNVEIDRVEYRVSLNQEPNGNSAILTSNIT